MNKLLLAALALAANAAAGGGASAAPAQVTAQDPEALRALFTRWGFSPNPLEVHEGTPSFAVRIDEVATAIGFGGCTNNRDCADVVLITGYADITNPPFEWLNEQNNYYELVTLTRDERGALQIHMAILLQPEGISEALFRNHVEEWVAANRAIAQRAIDAHLNQPQTAAVARSIAPLTARR